MIRRMGNKNSPSITITIRAIAICRSSFSQRPPVSSRLYEACPYAAASWSQLWRVVLKAEVMLAGDNPRFVVTSLDAPPPQMVYEDLSCARGNCENDIKAVTCDLHSDRTSAT